MRIIYLHQYYLTPESAGATRSYEMGRRLAQAGHEVHMITSTFDDRRIWPRWKVSEEAGMTVHRVEVPYSNRMGYVRRMWAFIAFAAWATVRAMRIRADVIFASSTPLTIAIPARVAATFQRIPYVFEVRDLWPKVPIELGILRNPVLIWMARGLERWAYRGAFRIVTLAPGMARHIAAEGYPEEHIVLIPNGCDLEVFSDDESAAAVRTNNSWLGERKMVVFAGTLGLVNGVGWLVEVAAHVRHLDPEVRFVIIGDGREYDQVLRRAIELDVHQVNVFMIGLRPKRETGSWIRAADAAISLTIDEPYIWENTVTNKFFDALAAERPILSNHPGYQTEIALEAGSGAVLDAHDHRKAAEELIELLHDDEWLRSASEASGNLARQRFDRNLLTKRLEEVLEQSAADHMTTR